MNKNKETEGIILGTVGRGMSFSSKRQLLVDSHDKLQYVCSDPKNDYRYGLNCELQIAAQKKQKCPAGIRLGENAGTVKKKIK